MLRDRNARARNHEGRGCRDVESGYLSSAGPAGIDQLVHGVHFESKHGTAQRHGSTGYLCAGLSFCPETHEQRG